jgi:hypothetical protein
MRIGTTTNFFMIGELAAKIGNPVKSILAAICYELIVFFRFAFVIHKHK